MLCHMKPQAKTTVYLDLDDYERLKQLARSQGRAAALLVREAIAQYVARPAGVAAPASLGIGRSGGGDVSERAESLLAGMGRKR